MGGVIVPDTWVKGTCYRWQWGLALDQLRKFLPILKWNVSSCLFCLLTEPHCRLMCNSTGPFSTKSPVHVWKQLCALSQSSFLSAKSPQLCYQRSSLSQDVVPLTGCPSSEKSEEQHLFPPPLEAGREEKSGIWAPRTWAGKGFILAVVPTDDTVTFLCVFSVLPILEYPDCPRGLGSVDSWEHVWSFRESVLYPLVISKLEAQAAHPEEPWQCTVNHVNSLFHVCCLALGCKAPAPSACAVCPFSPVLTVGWTKLSWLSVPVPKYSSGMCSVPSIFRKILKSPSHNNSKKCLQPKLEN